MILSFIVILGIFTGCSKYDFYEVPLINSFTKLIKNEEELIKFYKERYEIESIKKVVANITKNEEYTKEVFIGDNISTNKIFYKTIIEYNNQSITIESKEFYEENIDKKTYEVYNFTIKDSKTLNNVNVLKLKNELNLKDYQDINNYFTNN